MILRDLPRPVPLSLYEETRAAITRKYRGLPGVHALLEFGTIPHPGISDMDFFVIVEPDTPVVLPHFSTYTDEQRFAMVHRHFILSRTCFPHINEFDPWFVAVTSLEDPSGEFPFRKVRFPPEEYRALSLNFIYQKLVYGCLPMLADILQTQSISCRAFFEEIKLFQYFLREFRTLSIVPEAEDPALPFYRTLAEQWFSLPEGEQIARMEKAVTLYGDSITLIGKTLLSALHDLPLQPLPRALPPRSRLQRDLLRRFPQSFIFDAGNTVFVYGKNSAEMRIEEETLSAPLPGLPGLTRRIFHLPLSFAAFSTTHLSLDGCLSRFYQAHACTDLHALPRYVHPRLTSLFAHANENLWQTRHVRNGKYYEITYGYRPPGGNVLQRVKKWLLSLPARISRPLLAVKGTRTLFASSL